MTIKTKPALAVIGGSGLYKMKHARILEERLVETPFGEPSDKVLVSEIEGERVLFLPRHGRGHRILPSEINYRANLCALKMLGATRVVSVSAVGSMQETYRPGDIVIVDQFFDRTWGRAGTFFGEGIVAHIPFADPVCRDMGDVLHDTAANLGLRVHRGGTYLCIQGPAFSTRAESRIYRTWGVDVIGMTNLPEARLAREAELCYATLALVTDYDCWRTAEDNVDVASILETLNRSTSSAQDIVRLSATRLMSRTGCACQTALDGAIITDTKCRNDRILERLEPIAGRVLSCSLL